MFLSVFDVFKIGVGPSSSHTMGPMTAANRFLDLILSNDWPRPTSGAQVASMKVSLHGSLAHTGIGHGTGRAVILGLMGEQPNSVDPDKMDGIIDQVERTGRISPPGHPSYGFQPKNDLIFDKKQPLPGHANGMSFSAFDKDGRMLIKRIYYSVGGGFVVTDTELEQMRAKKKTPSDSRKVPYPFASAKQMLDMAARSGLSIAQMKRANEETQRSREELDAGLDRIWEAMRSCIERGLKVDGIMPGGLNVRRRARAIHDKLQEEWRSNRINPLLANDWLSVYAMAVNEENAAGGRVVTAPTNGAAGVIPATIRYYEHFHDDWDQNGIRDYLLTAAAVGGIIKHNASISGAEVGCQGEVGSAAAMAAAGLAAVMGGTPEQIENAAEIALEHHLGMSCDPVAGLVQVPCIERNALGAVKAVTAASLAIKGDGKHFVPLDACIETMRQTGNDMSEKYKETSTGGLAVNVVEC
ncbi:MULTISPECIES: L-serine ammonia-lyase [unclassified Rhizobium]|jgi:L-serine dehydratase|uniref:L-serine ammonia-lyase n=1 Tax=unclassified Rhizobium TaxID=2613769 RepID=UPI000271A092|nr:MULTISPECIES: L-serine ammonia-lyase [unclassified Rhizobium]EJL54505.1 L-serine dehydratase, iron-sulfur-dependent, single chain form [Rhizobium sp. CF122]MBB3397707.1 L-serine dehydratase [Rhizobium sp. BK060]MBB4170906.1 L-serine dehydratase [Rhizobium sp. BK538]TCM75396.1 L-serine dehydratase [Rhizobium sp. BK068]